MFDESDPRLIDDYVRHIPGNEEKYDLVLAGTVHDHPASMFRVRSLVETADPDVLALELPPIAVPLFERYANGETESDVGGEMSVAIRAASTDDVVGIDGPTPAFVAKLARMLYRGGLSRSTVGSVLGDLASVSKNAVACRIAAMKGAPAWARRTVYSPVDHECSETDEPGRQAADERTQVRRATSVTRVFGKSTSAHIRDETRETHMADQLRDLRRRGTVVAVVGMGHLESLSEHLQ